MPSRFLVIGLFFLALFPPRSTRNNHPPAPWTI